MEEYPATNDAPRNSIRIFLGAILRLMMNGSEALLGVQFDPGKKRRDDDQNNSLGRNDSWLSQRQNAKVTPRRSAMVGSLHGCLNVSDVGDSLSSGGMQVQF